MTNVHIEGLGVLGSMIARRLDEEGLDFTWNDTDEEAVAWRASTGLAYPESSPRAAAGLAIWKERAMPGPGVISETVEAEEVPYAFAHKAPPHGGRYPIAADYGLVRLAEPTGVAVNVRAFVENTRAAFSAERVDVRPAGSTLVIAHSTPERSDGYLWGWSARVRIGGLLQALEVDLLGDRPALYAKKHRFNTTYAYPRPGTDEWWVGTDIRYQATASAVPEAKLLEKYEAWVEDAREILGIRDVELVEVTQGWRPRARKGDSGAVEFSSELGAWTVPPMAANGVRMGWLVADEVLNAVGSGDLL